MAAFAALLVSMLAACGGTQGRAIAAGEPGIAASLPDGRTLNLRCAGHGSPTVLLESGFGADSGAWFKVQPALARKTRVCAYDRAGYGFSDPGPLPRDGAAIARDLDQALERAKIDGPYVVVGHSVGGLYGRLFAARRLKDVAGLVLLDPTIEHQIRPPASDGLDGIRHRLQRCLAAAEAPAPPPPGAPEWAGCAPAHGDAHAEAMARRPDTWRNQLSELDSIFGSTSSQAARLGNLLQEAPIYILTASETVDRNPSIRLGEAQSPWLMGHRILASRARLGWQQTILSSHMIMIDRPDAVIDATLAMVMAIRNGTPPEPLPPSESLPDLTPGLPK